MRLMICLSGEAEQLGYLPALSVLSAGVELGSYGRVGVLSRRRWEERLVLHKALRSRFDGPIALHGPFIGIQYGHVDHLIQDAVAQRLDMTLAAAVELEAERVVLHSGYTTEIGTFGLEREWLERSTCFWQQEIRRWTDAGIEVVIENDVEATPDLLIQLVTGVSSPYLGLCLDVGHQHLFSELAGPEWIQRMGGWLKHVHLHDNDRTSDSHSPIGQGTVDFGPICSALANEAPNATVSLEVEAPMDMRMSSFRTLAAHFRDA
ncbi:MAG: sugar phosphate isomerase/epimerase [bacterium]|nr:sugar phosphate isomerase/epimerase [bacterium]